MKIEVYTNLYIGDINSCSWYPSQDWAVIHSCKHPCHRKAVGYKNNLAPSHPNYLIWEQNRHLVLNMVDMDKELNPRFTNPIMRAAMSFIEKQLPENKIIVHCNQGLSRSPSIGLVYLARINIIDSSSFQNAKAAFRKIYPRYQPGLGISIYLKKNWATLLYL